MFGLNREGNRFINAYQGEIREFERAAELARTAVESVVRDAGVLVHAVSGRAKTLESLRGKLRRKQYKNPDLEVTDLIGVRVVTYYRDGVDPIVARLQKRFEINASASTDSEAL